MKAKAGLAHRRPKKPPASPGSATRGEKAASKPRTRTPSPNDDPRHPLKKRKNKKPSGAARSRAMDPHRVAKLVRIGAITEAEAMKRRTRTPERRKAAT